MERVQVNPEHDARIREEEEVAEQIDRAIAFIEARLQVGGRVLNELQAIIDESHIDHYCMVLKRVPPQD
jgi:hypothetical protein